jgi:hypothetical protein
MSAEANLDGLYPPVEPKKWNQLIPIHTVPKLQDNVSIADCFTLP